MEGKLSLLAAIVLTVAVGLASALSLRFQSLLVGVAMSLVVVLPLAVLLVRGFIRPITRTLQAVGDGIGSMKDDDFSVSVSILSRDELGQLVASYNGLADVLRTERQSLYQRELLLDTVIQSTPLTLVLTNAAGRIVYSNLAARQTFLEGRKLEGLSFPDLVKQAPEPLRAAVASGADTLFTVESSGESEAYFLSQRRFQLNGQSHSLYLLKQLTRELSREEVKTWKKVIRVIAHELNNSLAPISSLAHSGRRIAAGPDAPKLERIFSTIEERARHLHGFIDGYATFAKLPRPHLRAVSWKPFLTMLQDAVPFTFAGDVPPNPGFFDPTQMEQVLINLLKNAAEAGALQESIEITVEERAGGVQVQVLDRGNGMSDELLHNALLPFYSTKAAGAGLGLTVCREVLEAHGGRMSLANRAGGGLVVTLWIPAGGVVNGV